jgi:putative ABC transport system permease protein
MSIWTHFEALVLDLRYTCRFLIEDWTFTATVLATLAVSTGSTAAVFMLVDVLVRRTREIGVRMALGAEPRHVLLMVLRRALALVAIGIGVGLAAALGSVRAVASFLYGVSPVDPITITSATILLTVVGVSAGVIPARKAARMEPVGALRQD